MLLTTTDIIIIGSFLLLLCLYFFVHDWYGIREQPRRIDLKAAGMLAEHGYRTTAKAAVRTIYFTIGERKHRQQVKADLIVRRGLRKYVVEVNARDGSSVRNADIRRRLLEYQVAFSPDAIIAFDADRNRLRVIKVSNRRRLLIFLGLAAAAALGAVLYLLVR